MLMFTTHLAVLLLMYIENKKPFLFFEDEAIEMAFCVV